MDKFKQNLNNLYSQIRDNLKTDKDTDKTYFITTAGTGISAITMYFSNGLILRHNVDSFDMDLDKIYLDVESSFLNQIKNNETISA